MPSNLDQGQRSELLNVLLQQRSRITSFVLKHVWSRMSLQGKSHLPHQDFEDVSSILQQQSHKSIVVDLTPESKPNPETNTVFRSVSSVADSFWKIYRGQICNLVVLCGFALFNSKARCNFYVGGFPDPKKHLEGELFKVTWAVPFLQ